MPHVFRRLSLASLLVASAALAQTADNEFARANGGELNVVTAKTKSVHGSGTVRNNRELSGSAGAVFSDRLFTFGSIEQQHQLTTNRTILGRAELDATPSQHITARANDTSFPGSRTRSFAASWSGTFNNAVINDAHASTFDAQSVVKEIQFGDTISVLWKNHEMRSGAQMISDNEGAQKDLSLFAQDQWSVTPNVDVTAGVR